MSSLKKFLSAVEGSAAGFVNPEELYRSILTALGSGTVVGLVVVILQSILDHVGTIIPNSTVATLVTVILTLILDLLRRQTHGTDPAPTPAPSPAPKAA